MKKVIFSLFGISTFLFAACHKDQDHDMEDKLAPVLSITSPQEGAHYNNGDTIRIKYTVTENASLHELEMSFCNMSSNENSMECSYHVHDLKSYDIDTFCIAKVTANTACELKISAEDHSHNQTIKTVKVSCTPQ